MLGYKPFFKEYTTDWDYAVAKMQGSFFQCRLVHGAYSGKKPWATQEELSSGSKPMNAEYELWVTDLSDNVSQNLDAGTVGMVGVDVDGHKTQGINGFATGVEIEEGANSRRL